MHRTPHSWPLTSSRPSSFFWLLPYDVMRPNCWILLFCVWIYGAVQWYPISCCWDWLHPNVASAFLYPYRMLCMSLLPIMLSISVFLLLLVCWKGVRGGLSQLIYHIKYQPSSTFYLPLYPPFTRPPLFSFLLFTSHCFHPSFLSPPLLFLLLVCPCPCPSPVPSHLSLEALWRFSEGSHLSFFKQLPYAFVPHLPPGLWWPSVLISHRFSLPFHERRHALSPYHVRFAEVQYAR